MVVAVILSGPVLLRLHQDDLMELLYELEFNRQIVEETVKGDIYVEKEKILPG